MFRTTASWLSLILMLLIASPVKVAAADTLPAGFAPGPLWLSAGEITAGDSVQIYTVVYDSSTQAIEGAVTFLVDGTPIGSAPFELDPGRTSIESMLWKATEGTHSIEARVDTVIDQDSKQAQTLTRATTGTISVVVSPPKVTAPAAEPIILASTSSSIAAVVTSLASSSPLVGSVTSSVGAFTESIRASGEAFLLSKTNVERSPSGAEGVVLGASTETGEASEGKAQATEPSIIERAAKALLPLFAYPAIFYPILFLILIVLFVLIARRLRN